MLRIYYAKSVAHLLMKNLTNLFQEKMFISLRKCKTFCITLERFVIEIGMQNKYACIIVRHPLVCI